MTENANHPILSGAASRPGRRGLRLSLNGFMVILQLLLIFTLISGLWISNRYDSSILVVEWQMAAGCAGILLIIALPFALLAALIGLRRRCGAGRPADQPRRIFTIDMVALIVCLIILLLAPAIFVIASMFN